MLNIKVISLAVALLVGAAAFFANWTERQAKTAALKHSLSVEPQSAQKIQQFKDR
jgi:Tfp pilus assembly protein PilN